MENISQQTLFKLMSLLGAIILGLIIIFGSILFFTKLTNNEKFTEPTIIVNGTGDIMAKPDIAKISFTVTHDAKSMSEAQKVVTQKMATILEQLKKSNISETDIKTVNYNAYPKYEWKVNESLCNRGYCPDGKQEITGYTVSQNTEIKIRNTENIGAITQILTDAKVSDLQGPNFSIDDIEVLRAQSRSAAISDARKKAEVIARDLGVRLGRVVSFYENTDSPAYAMPAMEMSSDMMVAKSAAAGSAPTIPTGENKIMSNVSVTFRIR